LFAGLVAAFQQRHGFAESRMQDEQLVGVGDALGACSFDVATGVEADSPPRRGWMWCQFAYRISQEPAPASP
jgi:hypothetical protein